MVYFVIKYLEQIIERLSRRGWLVRLAGPGWSWRRWGLDRRAGWSIRIRDQETVAMFFVGSGVVARQGTWKWSL